VLTSDALCIKHQSGISHTEFDDTVEDGSQTKRCTVISSFIHFFYI